MLESGASFLHAINKRIANAVRTCGGVDLSQRARRLIASGLLIGCMFVADRFGLVALSATCYRTLAFILIAIYVLPLVTLGVWRLVKDRSPKEAA